MPTTRPPEMQATENPVMDAADALISVAHDEEMIDMYASSMIANVNDYYGIEIHGVRDLHDGDESKGTCCEIDNLRPQFISVYAKHKRLGGVDCVGDFSYHSRAKAYAVVLATKYDWPIVDHVLEQFRHSPPVEQLQ